MDRKKIIGKFYQNFQVDQKSQEVRNEASFRGCKGQSTPKIAFAVLNVPLMIKGWWPLFLRVKCVFKCAANKKLFTMMLAIKSSSMNIPKFRNTSKKKQKRFSWMFWNEICVKFKGSSKKVNFNSIFQDCFEKNPNTIVVKLCKQTLTLHVNKMIFFRLKQKRY